MSDETTNTSVDLQEDLSYASNDDEIGSGLQSERKSNGLEQPWKERACREDRSLDDLA